MRYLALILGSVAAALAASSVQAGSIWAKTTAAGAPPRVYADDIAYRVGDVLTIIINERSSVDNQTKRDNDKKADRSLKTGGSADIRDVAGLYGRAGHGTFNFPVVDATSAAETKLETKADFQSDRVLTDRVTVTVQDVLPSGNLLIQGRRTRNVHGDTQVVCVSGIVRPSDITFANTINSDQVAEFNMVTLVKGPENLITKPGWLGRFLNWASPW